MNFIEVGRIVNTHGIKGEIRILSNFEKKEQVFIPKFKMYIGKSKKEVEITNYRHHKDFEMITLKGYENINDVLEFKGNKIYINKDDLTLKKNEYLYSDLIGMQVIDENKTLGSVKDVFDNNGNVLLLVEGLKSFYIPLHSNYIKKIDLETKEIKTENGKDLII